jgi:hypothetical protein
MPYRRTVHRLLSSFAHAWMRALISSGAPSCAKILPPELSGRAGSGALGQSG